MVSPPEQLVVVDATPLRTSSGFRGIGRYVHDLLVGLAETKAEWEREVRIAALTQLSWSTPASVSFDLRAAAEETIARRGEVATHTMQRLRRLAGARELIARRAALFHETEPLGTPILGPPRVVTLYDLVALRFPDAYLSSKLLRPWAEAEARWRYGRAARVVAISERSRADGIALLGLEPDRVTVVSTGIELSKWTSTHPRPPASPWTRPPYCLYVGAADARKNWTTMFEALRVARESMDIELLWAGDLSKPILTTIHARARDLGIERSVRFLRYVDDATLVELYRGAAAHLFLSRLEGFGLSVAEAMAAGCPPIVARHSGCDELVGDAGIVVDADDARGAADALLRLVRRPEERAELARRGRERGLSMSRAAMASGYVDEYRAVLRSFDRRAGNSQGARGSTAL
jgi:glycosyltransferase involved in cell wall biosynthesis